LGYWVTLIYLNFPETSLKLSLKMAGKFATLLFSGKEEDFTYFAEQFEARMYTLKLTKVLLDKVAVTEETHNESGQDRTARLAEESALADLRYQVWCELVQCLDRKSVLLLRPNKGNGMEAWKALVQNFKSSERPRLQRNMIKLTTLRLEGNETVVDYLVDRKSVV
jgi:hypothetical protein